MQDITRQEANQILEEGEIDCPNCLGSGTVEELRLTCDPDVTDPFTPAPCPACRSRGFLDEGDLARLAVAA